MHTRAEHTSAEAADLRKACRLNLASCYLNMGRNQEAATLCSGVLAGDRANRKALYQWGLARAALRDSSGAVPDLEAAVVASPAAEWSTIAAKLKAVATLASRAHGPPQPNRPEKHQTCCCNKDLPNILISALEGVHRSRYDKSDISLRDATQKNVASYKWCTKCYRAQC